MAKAKQCDRCKRLYVYEAKKIKYKLQKLSGYADRYTRYTHALDLCPECDKSLGEWLEALQQEEK